MPAQPLVSCAIPSFNNGLTILEAIESCQKQTYSNIEIVIYDEASKDNTREIIYAAASKDPRIRIITSETNTGAGNAWNRVIQEARGEYCVLLFSDDIILPRHIEVLTDILERNPKQTIAGANAYSEILAETVKGENAGDIVTGIASRKYLHEFPTVTLKSDEYSLGILAAVFPVSPICSVMRTKAAQQVMPHCRNYENPYGFDFSKRAYGNDVALVSEVALLSDEITQIGEPLAVCRASPNSLTVNARRDHRWQYWLQYCWAIRACWERCRNLSPRMEKLIQVADDRTKFCEFFYALQKKQMPKNFHPIQIMRAIWYLLREDKRKNPKVGPATLKSFLGR